jgi:hypothetical protein
MPGPLIDALLFGCQQVNQQRAQRAFSQELSDAPVACAETAASTAVRKEHEACCRVWDEQIAVE